jgi:hypothetical protein
MNNLENINGGYPPIKIVVFKKIFRRKGLCLPRQIMLIL